MRVPEPWDLDSSAEERYTRVPGDHRTRYDEHDNEKSKLHIQFREVKSVSQIKSFLQKYKLLN